MKTSITPATSAVIKTLVEHGLLHADALTVTNKSIAENCKDATNWNQEVIRNFDHPLISNGVSPSCAGIWLPAEPS